MKNRAVVASAILLSLIMLIVSPGYASLIIGDGSNFHEILNNGAYITESTASSSLFSRQILSVRDGTSEGTIQFKNIPYFSFEDSLYFRFIYDLRETGGGPRISIDNIVVSAAGGAVWSLGSSFGSIILNDAKPFTNTPLSTGGDMELFVPVSLFNGLGLTGNSYLTLSVTQSDSHNGADEWVVLGSGTFFGPDDPINDPVSNVPIPSTLYLLGAGLIGLVGIQRIFRK